jgi:threonine aldolase
MAEAVVGDDVFGEDPTMNRLEEMAAKKLGKAAGLFVPSGTMANLIAVLVHCGRGDEMILGDQSHTFFYEQGGASAVAGVHPHIIRNQEDGTLDLGEIEAAIRPENIHFPRTRLIVLENTHNRCHGAPLGVAYLEQVRKLTKLHGLAFHVDGARLFNAAAALEIDAAQLAAPADSVSICLSKGLSAPVGSVLCGETEFIQKARRARKLLGGGMRQAGILAAAGIVALEEMVDRLKEDHANAIVLAEGIAEIEGIRTYPDRVTTNMVYIDVDLDDITAIDLLDGLSRQGALVLPTGPKRLRAVTHYPLTKEDMHHAVEIVQSVMKKARDKIFS